MIRTASLLVCSFVCVCGMTQGASYLMDRTIANDLKLELDIKRILGNATTTATYNVRVDLTNVSTASLEILENPGLRAERVEDTLTESIGFLTEPEALPVTWQTAGPPPSPRRTITLPAGQKLTWDWEAFEPHLKPAGILGDTMLCSPGRYSVSASFFLRVKNRGYWVCKSDPVTIDCGGKSGKPKTARAKVTQIDLSRKTATINIGSDDRIEVGDRFQLYEGLPYRWPFTVTKVSENESVGQIEIDLNKPTEFNLRPKVGTPAEMIPQIPPGS